MIDAVRIKNYKGFPDLHMPRLSRLTILGGGNNIGKTSLIEAIALHLLRHNTQIIQLFANFRGLNEIPLSPASLWFPMFYAYNTSVPIEIELGRGDRRDRMTIRYVPNYSPTIKRNAFQPDIAVGNLPALSYAIKAGNRDIFNAHGFFAGPLGYNLQIENAVDEIIETSLFLPSRNVYSPREDAGRLGSLDVTFQADKIVDYLRPLEPRLREISINPVEGTPIIHGDIGIGRKIPVNSMGDGMSRLLSIILAIASCRNGCVIIDEIGNGIHYSVMRECWQSIAMASKRFNCQLICTTHSYEFLQRAHEGTPFDDVSNFTYARMERETAGRMAAKTYDHETLGAALASGWEVR